MATHRRRRLAQWRRLRLSKKREAHRLSRLQKSYNPHKSLPAVGLLINPKVVLSGNTKGKISIELPAELHLETPEAANSSLEFIAKIRNAAFEANCAQIWLDHSKVVQLAPSVAVLMLAEIQRCNVYCRGRTVILGTYPNDHRVAELLTEIGFYDALRISPPKLPKTFARRTYLKIERKNRVLAQVADQLLSCFEKEKSFDPEARKRLHVALVECMDNVNQHAYEIGSNDPYLFKEWWMAGYADHDDGRIEFVFYDQGAGIPATIRRRKPLRILRRLDGWDDARWIQRAVTKQISRFQAPRRGHGLEKLKAFIESLDTEASLRVLANSGDFRIDNEGRTKRTNVAVSLQGTLVVWSISGVPPAATTVSE